MTSFAGGRDDFVGRHEQLEQLDRWMADADAGAAAFVLIEGDAGVGKSRLLGELTRRAHRAGWLALAGTGHEASAVPFLPMITALYPLVDFGTPDASGLDLDAGLATRFAAASDAVIAAGRADRVLVCLDDLHWFDEPSTELLAHLLSAVVHQVTLAPVRVLVAMACRPSSDADHVRRLVAHVRREPGTRRLPIAGLDLFDLAVYVEQLLGAPPDKAFLYELHDATQGNPLMTRAILDRLEAFGALHHVGDRVTADVLTELTALPRELEDMMRLRLDSLSRACDRTLTFAAFLGDDERVDDLRTVSGLDGEKFDDVLTEARQARLLDVRDGRYRFDHPTIGQVLYHRPAGRRRHELHRTIADRLAAAAPDPNDPQLAMVLAQHLRNAGAEVDPHRLTQVSLVAGNHAASVGAWAEAVRCFSTVVEASDDSSAFGVVLRRRLANACFHCHQFDVGKMHIAAATERGRALGDHRLWGESLLVQVNLEAATTESTGPVMDEKPLLAFVAAAEETEPGLAARVHAAIAQVRSTAGDLTSARVHVDRSRELAASSHDALTIAAVEHGAGIHHMYALEVDVAEVAFARSRAAAEQTNDQSSRTWPVTRLGVARYLRGDIDGARELLREAADRARPAWMWQELSYATALQGAIAAARGDSDAARRDCHAALRLFQWNTVWLTPLIAYPTLIALDLSDGEPARAAATLAEWRSIAGRSLQRHELLVVAARDGVDAAAALGRGRASPARTTATAMNADATIVDAVGAIALDSRDAAEATLPVLIDLRERCSVRFVPGWPALTTRLIAECTALAGDSTGAVEWFDRALADAIAAPSPHEQQLVTEARARAAC